VTPIDLGIEPLVSLIPVSVLAAIGMLLVFRHASDQAAIRRAKNLVAAHLLELRLYMDEPRLILRAQRDLIVANARFLKLMLRPVLVMTLPMALLLALMDGFYGHAPLPADRPALVTLQLKGGSSGPAPSLEPTPDVVVETPPVRAISQQQVSWRVRPVRESKGELRIVQNFRVVTKSIVVGEGVYYLSERRGSFADLLLHPTEWPLADNEIAWIEVQYPSARIFHLHWLIWFLLISGITAFSLRRRFRASF
jgi:hypothetical protein